MNCSKARKLINEYIDGHLDRGAGRVLESHVERCRSCRQLLADFEEIVEGAKNMDVHSPSARVWFRIKSRIKEEKKPAVRKKPFWLASGFRLAVSTLAVGAVIVGAALVGIHRWGGPKVTAGGKDGQYALAKLKEAEHHYQLAIEALWEAISSQEKSMDPQVMAVFRKNLEIIDVSLAACKKVVVSHPEDIESRNYLLAVYKEKMDLLAGIMSVQDKASIIREPDKII